MKERRHILQLHCLVEVQIYVKRISAVATVFHGFVKARSNTLQLHGLVDVQIDVKRVSALATTSLYDLLMGCTWWCEMS